MNNRQFDRSNSFTFFKNFKDTLDKYGAQFGTDVKLAMYDAIVDYGLYRRFPKDSLINTLLTPMMLDIDSSQERRAHGFQRRPSQGDHGRTGERHPADAA